MKFRIKNTKGHNINTLTRAISYRYLRENEEKKEHVLIRPLEIGGYPRFHLFLKIDFKNQEFIFNLHLDQKKPIYKGTPAHSADYEGEAVEREAERIKETLEKQ